MSERGGSLHRPNGTLARDGWVCLVDPETAGWAYSGLRVLELAAGESRSFETGPDEMVLLPLSGSATVTCGGSAAALDGRPSVWSGPTDFAYLPVGSGVTVSSVDGGRFALPAARSSRRLDFRVEPAQKVPVELRGAGSCSRQVNNFCIPETFEADKLIACEVLTPAGNWSSYPPHKHDENRPGESVLEEIYYYEIEPVDTGGGAPRGSEPIGGDTAGGASHGFGPIGGDTGAAASGLGPIGGDTGGGASRGLGPIGGDTGGGASRGLGPIGGDTGAGASRGLGPIGGDTGGGAPRGLAYQQVYGTSSVLAEVRTGDVVLIPNGWHGPSMAAPGYDLYYLNVMAGPAAERAWLISDDPAHAWVRSTWADQAIDPRLPFGRDA